ncbi:MAG: alpha/beta fold hydrolase [Thermoflexales bacterium]|nr:alpha/beta fold hydrolase [Thermoflexales bacterium]
MIEQPRGTIAAVFHPGFSLPHRYRPARAEGVHGALILLHGYGSNEDDLFSLTPYLDERFHVLSLRAPLMLMPGAYAWFPLTFTARGEALVNADDALRNLHHALQIIREAARALAQPPQRTFLLGFSQGAVIAAAALALMPEHLAGGVLMSGAAPPSDLASGADVLRGKTALVTHGVHDTVLPVQHGRALAAWLRARGAHVTHCEYAADHTVDEAMLEDLDRWLGEQLDTAAD